MLKVGIVGIGFMGMIHYLAYQRIENVKVVALCESYAKERLAGDWTKIKGNFGPQGTQMDLTGIATYDNIEALLADPNVDVVDICLPPAGHAANTIAALNAGKNVFCEKPISLKPEEGVAMVEAAKQNGKLLMPVSVRMNHAIADGYLIANVFRLLEKEMANFVRTAPDL